jgi:NET1-associated nuclear protein 1 (U3 small nucleolar RNA-associated protein 17)
VREPECAKIGVPQLIPTILDTWMSYATLTFRSETPTSVSWSPDSSLFAVSVGPCVAIYHAQTSFLCQMLTSPNGRTNNSSHFIGGDGRFLLASGSEFLVLWDLVDNRGMSTIDDLKPISLH